MTRAESHILECLSSSERGLSVAQMWKAEPWWLRLNLFSGGLYAAILKLERDGKIQGAWVDGGYPRRKIYYLVKNEPRPR